MTVQDSDTETNAGAEIVVLHPTLTIDGDTTYRPRNELVDRLTQWSFRPDAAKLRARLRWWLPALIKMLLSFPFVLTAWLWRELAPTSRGFGRFVDGWYGWVSCHTLKEGLPHAEGKAKTDLSVRIDHVRTNRIRATVASLTIFIGGILWLAAYNWTSLVIALLAVFGVLDGIGRWNQDKINIKPSKRLVLHEGMPFNRLTASIIAVLHDEGIDDAVAEGVVQWDQSRQQYRLGVATYRAIKVEHLRAIERGIGAKDYSVRMLNTETATSKELVITYGDPFTNVPKPPELITGSLSITQPMLLGVSITETPFAIIFAGVHVGIVSITGGGKTKGIIWAIINALSACRDCVLWGIDLQNGPALPMWRGVIQKAAYTPEEAGALLDAALAEMQRRMQILREIAEDDDPTNDTDEWISALGPALVIIIDEFAILADFNGTPSGTLNLVKKVEDIHRLGRKVWVTVIRGSQKTGKSDSGSTVISSQTGVWIVGPCTMRDTTDVFGTDRRDAGWTPHLLMPAVDSDVRDAGKVYIDSYAHRTPDVYRSWTPLTPREVKERAGQRLRDGLPRLDGSPTASTTVDAVIVPPALAAIEAAFQDLNPVDGRLPSDLVVQHANRYGGHWTADKLLRTLKTELKGVYSLSTTAQRSVAAGQKTKNCYLREDVEKALRSLGT